MGGPNLLRSQLSLSDREGEKLIPVIQNGVPGTTMPAMGLPASDAKAVASFVRSVLGTIGGQGKPPSELAPPSILVGNAEAGKAYFDGKCAGCHSATGDLAGIGKRIGDPKLLQNTWVAGGGRGGRGRAREAGKPVTVTITAAGSKVEGRLIRMDDFVVTVEMEDGSARSVARDVAPAPKVEVHDPLAGHRALLPVYTDADMHNVTSYLVTLQ
jgi:cytochrome c oxidase cbb3-type subunit 3